MKTNVNFKGRYKVYFSKERDIKVREGLGQNDWYESKRIRTNR